MENQQYNSPGSETAEVTLRENVTQVMKHYFANLKGEETRQIYDFFLDEIEEPLLIAVLKYTHNNQSKAARILGLSRGTLRTKLQKYGLL
jgi:Fis family transcriptional regulator